MFVNAMNLRSGSWVRKIFEPLVEPSLAERFRIGRRRLNKAELTTAVSAFYESNLQWSVVFHLQNPKDMK